MPKQVAKRRLHWAAYLWPGLPHLWNGGSWAGLTLAVGFAVLLNTLILAVFVWPQWLPERPKLLCGLSVAAIWMAAIWETRGELRRQAARLASNNSEEEDSESQLGTTGEIEREQEFGHDNEPIQLKTADANRLDELFVESQRHYLAEDWIESERSLVTLLRIDRDDIEARLLLAGIMRRSGRERKAVRVLNRLARREDAAGWLFEIDRERELLNTDLATTSQAENVEDQEQAA